MCTIVHDNETGLVCNAVGNPSDIDFTWSIKSKDEPFDDSNARQDKYSSYLPLDDAVIEAKTYVCVANNTVGIGTYCEIEIDGEIV